VFPQVTSTICGGALATQHRLIVHIDEADRGADWDGRIRFAGATGGHRYLRIDLKRLPAPSAAAVLAHELQHAAEIATERVETVHAFNALFRTIGFQVPWGPPGRYDTTAAIAVGTATLHELTGRSVRSAWPRWPGRPDHGERVVHGGLVP
jgi:hypothetical protein